MTLSGDMTFSLNSTNQFTLTCISTGGPATTVTWTRDSTTLTEGNDNLIDTVVHNKTTGRSIHTLLVTGRVEGVYRCSVNNSVSTGNSSQLIVEGEEISHSRDLVTCIFPPPPAPPPPSDVAVSQNGLNSLLVTWTPSPGPNVTGYTISYQQIGGGDGGSETVEETATNVIISGLMTKATYSIDISTDSSTLPSNVFTVSNVTIGKKECSLLETY